MKEGRKRCFLPLSSPPFFFFLFSSRLISRASKIQKAENSTETLASQAMCRPDYRDTMSSHTVFISDDIKDNVSNYHVIARF